MKYNDEYVDLSDKVDYIIDSCIIDGHEESVMRDTSIDFANILYKRLVDEEKIVNVDGENISLLPLGVISDKVRRFLNHNIKGANKRGLLSLFKRLLSEQEDFKTLCYPEDLTSPSKKSLEKLCASYIEYYKDSLDEEWSEEDFYRMFSELNYMSLKYAKREETEEPYVIGFFGAYERSGAGGKALTNAELYVMPEFRGLGIAKMLVGVTFDQAKANGITSFDSITYHIKKQNSLAFWERIGASVSGLIHIEGDIPEMLDVISKKDELRK